MPGHRILGGYFNGYHVADPDNYIKFDALAIDDQFIGPPLGFVGGSDPDSGVDQALPDGPRLDQAGVDLPLADALEVDRGRSDGAQAADLLETADQQSSADQAGDRRLDGDGCGCTVTDASLSPLALALLVLVLWRKLRRVQALSARRLH